MKKEKTITRTFKVTKVTALLLDLETAEPYNHTFYLEGHFKNDASILKESRKLIENSDSGKVSVAHIVESKEMMIKCVMRVEDFIESSFIEEK